MCRGGRRRDTYVKAEEYITNIEYRYESISVILRLATSWQGWHDYRNGLADILFMLLNCTAIFPMFIKYLPILIS